MVGDHIGVPAYPVTNGTVYVMSAIRFYPYFVPNGTITICHHQQDFADCIEKVFSKNFSFRSLPFSGV